LKLVTFSFQFCILQAIKKTNKQKTRGVEGPGIRLARAQTFQLSQTKAVIELLHAQNITFVVVATPFQPVFL